MTDRTALVRTARCGTGDQEENEYKTVGHGVYRMDNE